MGIVHSTLVRTILPSPQTPPHTPPVRRPATPKAPRKTRGKRFYLFLDVQTTTEDMPQIVALDAVLFSQKDGEYQEEENAMAAVVRPKRGYSVLRHMQDVRYHGVPAQLMATNGVDSFQAVNQLFVMLRLAMNIGGSLEGEPSLVVVGHGVEGMMSNFLSAAKVDKSLHPLWDELEDLCQENTHDTLDEAMYANLDLKNYTVAALLGEHYGRRTPGNRAQAVADLYFELQRTPDTHNDDDDDDDAPITI